MIKNLLAVFLIIAAVAVFWVETKPLLSEIDQLKAEKASFVRALTRVRDLEIIRNKLVEEQFNEISALDRTRLKNMIPSTPDATKLMIQLDNLARENGLLVKKLEVNPSSGRSSKGPAAKDYSELTINYDVLGRYESFKHLLSQLEKSLRLIEISQISLSATEKNFRSNEENGDLLYDFTIKASAFFKK
jgi:Tfp pilus assembly protein PilO